MIIKIKTKDFRKSKGYHTSECPLFFALKRTIKKYINGEFEIDLTANNLKIDIGDETIFRSISYLNLHTVNETGYTIEELVSKIKKNDFKLDKPVLFIVNGLKSELKRIGKLIKKDQKNYELVSSTLPVEVLEPSVNIEDPLEVSDFTIKIHPRHFREASKYNQMQECPLYYALVEYFEKINFSYRFFLVDKNVIIIDGITVFDIENGWSNISVITDEEPDLTVDTLIKRAKQKKKVGIYEVKLLTIKPNKI